MEYTVEEVLGTNVAFSLTVNFGAEMNFDKVQSDWTQADSLSMDFIKNKPDLVDFVATTVTSDEINYDITRVPADLGAGQTAWDSDEGCVVTGLADGGQLQNGKELFDYYVNADTVPLVNGDIVSIVPIAGNRKAIARTNVTNQQSAHNVIGMVTVPSVAVGATGRVTKFGEVHDLLTSLYPDGTELFVSESNSGKWATVASTPPNYTVKIGTVIVSQNGNGIVELGIQCFPKLGDLSDVNGVSSSVNKPIVRKADGVIDAIDNLTLASFSKTGSSDAEVLLGGGGSKTLQSIYDTSAGVVAQYAGQAEQAAIDAEAALLSAQNAQDAAEAAQLAAEQAEATALANNELLGGIAYNAAAPTPGKSGKYSFTTGGSCTWLTGGAATVAVGDEVVVVFTAPSNYTYTKVGRPDIEQTRSQSTSKVPSSKLVDDELNLINSELNLIIDDWKPFDLTISNGIMTFTSNPLMRTKIGGYKGLYLFDPSEAFTLDVSAPNIVAFFDRSLLLEKTDSSFIGKSNIQIANWTTQPDLSNKIILFEITGDLENTGVIGFYKNVIKESRKVPNLDLLSNSNKLELDKINDEIGCVFNPFTNFDFTYNADVYLSFSANPYLVTKSGKEINLFNPAESFVIDIPAGVYHQIFYFDRNFLKIISNGGYIGKSNIQVSSWLEWPDLTDKIVIARFTIGLFDYFGLLGEYQIQKKIKSFDSNLASINNVFPDMQSDVSSLNITDKALSIDYTDAKIKAQNAISAILNRNQDVNIVVIGDSISEHPQEYTSNTRTAPLLHRRNAPSSLFNFLNWGLQEYRRADDSQYIFSETGTFVTANSASSMLDDWDDKNPTVGTGFQAGFTRYTTSENASLSFVVPADSFAFRFIYRKDIAGGNMTITVSEGNNQIQIFNGTSWVEANGYIFNTLQTPDYPNYIGNTKYQERLMFRSRDVNGSLNSIGNVKTITITKAAGVSVRFCYWGVEWSKREHMITLYNNARGSADIIDLTKTLKTDLFDRNPALLMFQIPLINMGVQYNYAVPPSSHNTQVNNFLSLIKSNLPLCEIISYLPNFSIYMDAWESGSNVWKSWYNEAAKKVITVEDYYLQMLNNLKNDSSIGVIDTFNVYSKMLLKDFATYSDALQPSYMQGNTYTDDGVHLNVKGANVIFQCIKKLFE